MHICLKATKLTPQIIANGASVTPLNQSPAMQSVLLAGLSKTNGVVKNMTLTTAVSSQQTYLDVCDYAYMQIINGTQSYTSAIATAIKRAARAGATVLYPSGKRDKIDVAIRRAAVTGVNQTVSKLSLEHAKELDCDLVEVTAHMGAREEHVSWQGGIFSLVGRKGQYDDFYKVTGYGSGPGLCGWNCRHSFYPFYEGSTPAYSKEQLEEYNKIVGEYNGKKYNDYEASQRQRYYERQIRQTKRELVGYDSAISSTKDEALKKELRAQFTQSSVKLKAQEARMREFLKATNRLEDSSRTQVLKFNKSVSQKAVWAEKNAVKSGAYSGAKKTEGWQDRHAKLMYEEIRNRTTDVKHISQNTPFSEGAVKEIKKHIFFEKHRFSDGTVRRFDYDFDQAQAWNRLSQGKGTNIDLVMLKHEYVELTQMRIHDYDYETAHKRANKYHNWAEILIKEMK